MPIPNFIILISYTVTICVLIWARLKFFPVDSHQAERNRYFYDPVVIVHILATIYTIFIGPAVNPQTATLAIVGYSLGNILFFYTIQYSRFFSFAGSNKIERIVITGPYHWIRHPLYVSYLIIWITSTFIFNSALLWITLLYLTGFYIAAAKTEEKHLKSSKYSREYEEYCQNVGMFIPRIKKWKN